MRSTQINKSLPSEHGLFSFHVKLISTWGLKHHDSSSHGLEICTSKSVNLTPHAYWLFYYSSTKVFIYNYNIITVLFQLVALYESCMLYISQQEISFLNCTQELHLCQYICFSAYQLTLAFHTCEFIAVRCEFRFYISEVAFGVSFQMGEFKCT